MLGRVLSRRAPRRAGKRNVRGTRPARVTQRRKYRVNTRSLEVKRKRKPWVDPEVFDGLEWDGWSWPDKPHPTHALLDFVHGSRDRDEAPEGSTAPPPGCRWNSMNHFTQAGAIEGGKVFIRDPKKALDVEQLWDYENQEEMDVIRSEMEERWQVWHTQHLAEHYRDIVPANLPAPFFRSLEETNDEKIINQGIDEMSQMDLPSFISVYTDAFYSVCKVLSVQMSPDQKLWIDHVEKNTGKPAYQFTTHANDNLPDNAPMFDQIHQGDPRNFGSGSLSMWDIFRYKQWVDFGKKIGISTDDPVVPITHGFLAQPVFHPQDEQRFLRAMAEHYGITLDPRGLTLGFKNGHPVAIDTAGFHATIEMAAVHADTVEHDDDRWGGLYEKTSNHADREEITNLYKATVYDKGIDVGIPQYYFKISKENKQKLAKFLRRKKMTFSEYLLHGNGEADHLIANTPNFLRSVFWGIALGLLFGLLWKSWHLDQLAQISAFYEWYDELTDKDKHEMYEFQQTWENVQKTVDEDELDEYREAIEADWVIFKQSHGIDPDTPLPGSG